MRTETRPDRLEEGHQLARLEVGAAVEGHVLEEVRQASLIVVLLHAADVDGEPQRHAIGRAGVLAEEVAQPVWQAAGANRRIQRQRLGQGGGRRGRWRGRRGHLRVRTGHRHERQRHDEDTACGTEGHLWSFDGARRETVGCGHYVVPEPRVPSPAMISRSMQLTFSRLSPDVPVPVYGTAGSAAFDLAAAADVEVPPHGIALVPTGLVVQVPAGHFLAIIARSSTPLKRGLMVANGVGVIDSDYCGPADEVKVQVINVTETPSASPPAIGSPRRWCSPHRGWRSSKQPISRPAPRAADSAARGAE